MITVNFSQAFASLLDRFANRHQFLILFGIPRRRRLILLPFALSHLCVNAPSNCSMLKTVECDSYFLSVIPGLLISCSFVLHIASLTIESDRLLHIVWSSILPHRSWFCVNILRFLSHHGPSQTLLRFWRCHRTIRPLSSRRRDSATHYTF